MSSEKSLFLLRTKIGNIHFRKHFPVSDCKSTSLNLVKHHIKKEFWKPCFCCIEEQVLGLRCDCWQEQQRKQILSHKGMKYNFTSSLSSFVLHMHYLFPRPKIKCQECIKSSLQVLVSLNERREKLLSLDETMTAFVLYSFSFHVHKLPWQLWRENPQTTFD